MNEQMVAQQSAYEEVSDAKFLSRSLGPPVPGSGQSWPDLAAGS